MELKEIHFTAPGWLRISQAFQQLNLFSNFVSCPTKFTATEHFKRWTISTNKLSDYKLDALLVSKSFVSGPSFLHPSWVYSSFDGRTFIVMSQSNFRYGCMSASPAKKHFWSGIETISNTVSTVLRMHRVHYWSTASRHCCASWQNVNTFKQSRQPHGSIKCYFISHSYRGVLLYSGALLSTLLHATVYMYTCFYTIWWMY
jgi:hypothetical protein